jgi:hypothetical protein
VSDGLLVVEEGDVARELGGGRALDRGGPGLHGGADGLDDVEEAGGGGKTPGDACGKQFRQVFLREDPAHVNGEVGSAQVGEGLDELGAQHQVRIGHHAGGDDVAVLVAGGDGEGAWGLPEAGVDDVDAGIAEGAGDDFDAAVVPVEPHLSQEDAGAVGEVGAPVFLLELGGGGV